MRRAAPVLARLAFIATSCARPAAYWESRWLDIAGDDDAGKPPPPQPTESPPPQAPREDPE